jgi:FkbM family methyltransferase
MPATGQAMTDSDEAVADAMLDAKMREVWALFDDRPKMQERLRAALPPTRAAALGCEFIVHPRDNWTEYILWRDGRLPEEEATGALCRRLSGRDATIVDVGANAGAFSLPILRAAGAGARALLVEPNPVMRARLGRNIAINGLEGVEVLPCAISDRDGSARLHFPRYGNLGQGRVDAAYGAHEDWIEVTLRRLPSCLREAGIDQVDLLKVDVEGLEDRVIAPLLEDGAVLPGLIYFEVAHKTNWTCPLTDLLERNGYTLDQVFGPNALYRKTDARA